eukprot:GHVU01056247.1.p1 GENE.GHVU01056247.1~~GHVU01056247.1.p1  ORF type:complete len:144 (+),score=17.45 GHVU01056247.1:2187-2618(+)
MIELQTVRTLVKDAEEMQREVEQIEAAVSTAIRPRISANHQRFDIGRDAPAAYKGFTTLKIHMHIMMGLAQRKVQGMLKLVKLMIAFEYTDGADPAEAEEVRNLSSRLDSLLEFCNSKEQSLKRFEISFVGACLHCFGLIVHR